MLANRTHQKLIQYRIVAGGDSQNAMIQQKCNFDHEKLLQSLVEFQNARDLEAMRRSLVGVLHSVNMFRSSHKKRLNNWYYVETQLQSQSATKQGKNKRKMKKPTAVKKGQYICNTTFLCVKGQSKTLNYLLNGIQADDPSLIPLYLDFIKI